MCVSEVTMCYLNVLEGILPAVILFFFSLSLSSSVYLSVPNNFPVLGKFYSL